MKTLIKFIDAKEIARQDGYAKQQDALNAGNSWTRDCRIHKNELDKRSFIIVDTKK